MFNIIPNWHPVFVHFTIALLSTSVVLYVLAAVFKQHRWRNLWLMVANWQLWIGSGFAIITAIAGWLAYNSVAHDAPSHEAMTIHRNWALATLAVFIPLAVWSFVKFRSNLRHTRSFLAISVIAVGLLMSTGWRGSEVVYRYGIGVMSLPQIEAETHDKKTGETASNGHDTH